MEGHRTGSRALNRKPETCQADAPTRPRHVTLPQVLPLPTAVPTEPSRAEPRAALVGIQHVYPLSDTWPASMRS